MKKERKEKSKVKTEDRESIRIYNLIRKQAQKKIFKKLHNSDVLKLSNFFTFYI